MQARVAINKLYPASIYATPAVSPLMVGVNQAVGLAQRNLTHQYSIQQMAMSPFSVNSESYMKRIRGQYGYDDNGMYEVMGTIGAVVGAGMGAYIGIGGFGKNFKINDPTTWTSKRQRTSEAFRAPVSSLWKHSKEIDVYNNSLKNLKEQQKILTEYTITHKDIKESYETYTKYKEGLDQLEKQKQDILNGRGKKTTKIKKANAKQVEIDKYIKDNADKIKDLDIDEVTEYSKILNKVDDADEVFKASTNTLKNNLGDYAQNMANAGKSISKAAGTALGIFGTAMDVMSLGMNIAGANQAFKDDQVLTGVLYTAGALGDVVSIIGDFLPVVGTILNVAGAALSGISGALIGSNIGATIGHSLTPEGARAQALYAKNLYSSIIDRPLTTIATTITMAGTQVVLNKLSASNRWYGEAARFLSHDAIGNYIRSPLTMLATQGVQSLTTKIEDTWKAPQDVEDVNFVSVFSLAGDLNDNLFGATARKATLLGLAKGDPKAQTEAIARAWGYSDDTYYSPTFDAFRQAMGWDLGNFGNSLFSTLGEILIDPQNLTEISQKVVTNRLVDQGVNVASRAFDLDRVKVLTGEDVPEHMKHLVYEYTRDNNQIKKVDGMKVYQDSNGKKFKLVNGDWVEDNTINMSKATASYSSLGSLSRAELQKVLRVYMDAYIEKGVKGISEVYISTISQKGSKVINMDKFFVPSMESFFNDIVSNRTSYKWSNASKLNVNQLKDNTESLYKYYYNKNEDTTKFLATMVKDLDLDLEKSAEVFRKLYKVHSGFKHQMDLIDNVMTTAQMISNPLMAGIKYGHKYITDFFSALSYKTDKRKAARRIVELEDAKKSTIKQSQIKDLHKAAQAQVEKNRQEYTDRMEKATEAFKEELDKQGTTANGYATQIKKEQNEILETLKQNKKAVDSIKKYNQINSLKDWSLVDKKRNVLITVTKENYNELVKEMETLQKNPNKTVKEKQRLKHLEDALMFAQLNKAEMDYIVDLSSKIDSAITLLSTASSIAVEKLQQIIGEVNAFTTLYTKTQQENGKVSTKVDASIWDTLDEEQKILATLGINIEVDGKEFKVGIQQHKGPLRIQVETTFEEVIQKYLNTLIAPVYGSKLFSQVQLLDTTPITAMFPEGFNGWDKLNKEQQIAHLKYLLGVYCSINPEYLAIFPEPDTSSVVNLMWEHINKKSKLAKNNVIKESRALSEIGTDPDFIYRRIAQRLFKDEGFKEILNIVSHLDLELRDAAKSDNPIVQLHLRRNIESFDRSLRKSILYPIIYNYLYTSTADPENRLLLYGTYKELFPNIKQETIKKMIKEKDITKIAETQAMSAEQPVIDKLVSEYSTIEGMQAHNEYLKSKQQFMYTEDDVDKREEYTEEFFSQIIADANNVEDLKDLLEDTVYEEAKKDFQAFKQRHQMLLDKIQEAENREEYSDTIDERTGKLRRSLNEEYDTSKIQKNITVTGPEDFSSEVYNGTKLDAIIAAISKKGRYVALYKDGITFNVHQSSFVHDGKVSSFKTVVEGEPLYGYDALIEDVADTFYIMNNDKNITLYRGYKKIEHKDEIVEAYKEGSLKVHYNGEKTNKYYSRVFREAVFRELYIMKDKGELKGEDFNKELRLLPQEKINEIYYNARKYAHKKLADDTGIKIGSTLHAAVNRLATYELQTYASKFDGTPMVATDMVKRLISDDQYLMNFLKDLSIMPDAIGNKNATYLTPLASLIDFLNNYITEVSKDSKPLVISDYDSIKVEDEEFYFIKKDGTRVSLLELVISTKLNRTQLNSLLHKVISTVDRDAMPDVYSAVTNKYIEIADNYSKLMGGLRTRISEKEFMEQYDNDPKAKEAYAIHTTGWKEFQLHNSLRYKPSNARVDMTDPEMIKEYYGSALPVWEQANEDFIAGKNTIDGVKFEDFDSYFLVRILKSNIPNSTKEKLLKNVFYYDFKVAKNAGSPTHIKEIEDIKNIYEEYLSTIPASEIELREYTVLKIKSLEKAIEFYTQLNKKFKDDITKSEWIKKLIQGEVSLELIRDEFRTRTRISDERFVPAFIGPKDERKVVIAKRAVADYNKLGAGILNTVITAKFYSQLGTNKFSKTTINDKEYKTLIKDDSIIIISDTTDEETARIAQDIKTQINKKHNYKHIYVLTQEQYNDIVANKTAPITYTEYSISDDKYAIQNKLNVKGSMVVTPAFIQDLKALSKHGDFYKYVKYAEAAKNYPYDYAGNVIGVTSFKDTSMFNDIVKAADQTYRFFEFVNYFRDDKGDLDTNLNTLADLYTNEYFKNETYNIDSILSQQLKDKVITKNGKQISYYEIAEQVRADFRSKYMNKEFDYSNVLSSAFVEQLNSLTNIAAKFISEVSKVYKNTDILKKAYAKHNNTDLQNLNSKQIQEQFNLYSKYSHHTKDLDGNYYDENNQAPRGINFINRLRHDWKTRRKEITSDYKGLNDKQRTEAKAVANNQLDFRTMYTIIKEFERIKELTKFNSEQVRLLFPKEFQKLGTQKFVFDNILYPFIQNISLDFYTASYISALTESANETGAFVTNKIIEDIKNAPAGTYNAKAYNTTPEQILAEIKTEYERTNSSDPFSVYEDILKGFIEATCNGDESARMTLTYTLDAIIPASPNLQVNPNAFMDNGVFEKPRVKINAQDRNYYEYKDGIGLKRTKINVLKNNAVKSELDPITIAEHAYAKTDKKMSQDKYEQLVNGLLDHISTVLTSSPDKIQEYGIQKETNEVYEFLDNNKISTVQGLYDYIITKNINSSKIKKLKVKDSPELRSLFRQGLSIYYMINPKSPRSHQFDNSYKRMKSEAQELGMDDETFRTFLNITLQESAKYSDKWYILVKGAYEVNDTYDSADQMIYSINTKVLNKDKKFYTYLKSQVGEGLLKALGIKDTKAISLLTDWKKSQTLAGFYKKLQQSNIEYDQLYAIIQYINQIKWNYKNIRFEKNSWEYAAHQYNYADKVELLKKTQSISAQQTLYYNHNDGTSVVTDIHQPLRALNKVTTTVKAMNNDLAHMQPTKYIRTDKTLEPETIVYKEKEIRTSLRKIQNDLTGVLYKDHDKLKEIPEAIAKIRKEVADSFLDLQAEIRATNVNECISYNTTYQQIRELFTKVLLILEPDTEDFVRLSDVCTILKAMDHTSTMSFYRNQFEMWDKKNETKDGINSIVKLFKDNDAMINLTADQVKAIFGYIYYNKYVDKSIEVKTDEVRKYMQNYALNTMNAKVLKNSTAKHKILEILDSDTADKVDRIVKIIYGDEPTTEAIDKVKTLVVLAEATASNTIATLPNIWDTFEIATTHGSQEILDKYLAESALIKHSKNIVNNLKKEVDSLKASLNKRKSVDYYIYVPNIPSHTKKAYTTNKIKVDIQLQDTGKNVHSIVNILDIIDDLTKANNQIDFQIENLKGTMYKFKDSVRRYNAQRLIEFINNSPKIKEEYINAVVKYYDDIIADKKKTLKLDDKFKDIVTKYTDAKKYFTTPQYAILKYYRDEILNDTLQPEDIDTIKQEFELQGINAEAIQADIQTFKQALKNMDDNELDVLLKQLVNDGVIKGTKTHKNHIQAYLNRLEEIHKVEAQKEKFLKALNTSEIDIEYTDEMFRHILKAYQNVMSKIGKAIKESHEDIIKSNNYTYNQKEQLRKVQYNTREKYSKVFELTYNKIVRLNKLTSKLGKVGYEDLIAQCKNAIKTKHVNPDYIDKVKKDIKTLGRAYEKYAQADELINLLAYNHEYNDSNSQMFLNLFEEQLKEYNSDTDAIKEILDEPIELRFDKYEYGQENKKIIAQLQKDKQHNTDTINRLYKYSDDIDLYNAKLEELSGAYTEQNKLFEEYKKASLKYTKKLGKGERTNANLYRTYYGLSKTDDVVKHVKEQAITKGYLTREKLDQAIKEAGGDELHNPAIDCLITMFNYMKQTTAPNKFIVMDMETVVDESETNVPYQITVIEVVNGKANISTTHYNNAVFSDGTLKDPGPYLERFINQQREVWKDDNLTEEEFNEHIESIINRVSRIKNSPITLKALLSTLQTIDCPIVAHNGKRFDLPNFDKFAKDLPRRLLLAELNNVYFSNASDILRRLGINANADLSEEDLIKFKAEVDRILAITPTTETEYNQQQKIADIYIELLTKNKLKEEFFTVAQQFNIYKSETDFSQVYNDKNGSFTKFTDCIYDYILNKNNNAIQEAMELFPDFTEDDIKEIFEEVKNKIENKEPLLYNESEYKKALSSILGHLNVDQKSWEAYDIAQRIDIINAQINETVNIINVIKSNPDAITEYNKHIENVKTEISKKKDEVNKLGNEIKDITEKIDKATNGTKKTRTELKQITAQLNKRLNNLARNAEMYLFASFENAILQENVPMFDSARLNEIVTTSIHNINNTIKTLQILVDYVANGENKLNDIVDFSIMNVKDAASAFALKTDLEKRKAELNEYRTRLRTDLWSEVADNIRAKAQEAVVKYNEELNSILAQLGEPEVEIKTIEQYNEFKNNLKKHIEEIATRNKDKQNYIESLKYRIIKDTMFRDSLWITEHKKPIFTHEMYVAHHSWITKEIEDIDKSIAYLNLVTTSGTTRAVKDVKKIATNMLHKIMDDDSIKQLLTEATENAMFKSGVSSEYTGDPDDSEAIKKHNEEFIKHAKDSYDMNSEVMKKFKEDGINKVYINASDNNDIKGLALDDKYYYYQKQEINGATFIKISSVDEVYHLLQTITIPLDDEGKPKKKDTWKVSLAYGYVPKDGILQKPEIAYTSKPYKFTDFKNKNTFKKILGSKQGSLLPLSTRHLYEYTSGKVAIEKLYNLATKLASEKDVVKWIENQTDIKDIKKLKVSYLKAVNMSEIVRKKFADWQPLISEMQKEYSFTDTYQVYAEIFRSVMGNLNAIKSGQYVNLIPEDIDQNALYVPDPEGMEKLNIDELKVSEANMGYRFSIKTGYSIPSLFTLNTNSVRSVLTSNVMAAMYTPIGITNDLYARQEADGNKNTNITSYIYSPEEQYKIDEEVKNNYKIKQQRSQFKNEDGTIDEEAYNEFVQNKIKERKKYEEKRYEMFEPYIKRGLNAFTLRTADEETLKKYKNNVLHEVGVTLEVAFTNDTRAHEDTLLIDKDVAKMLGWNESNKTWLKYGFKGAVKFVEGLKAVYGADIVSRAGSVNERGSYGAYIEQALNKILDYSLGMLDKNDVAYNILKKANVNLKQYKSGDDNIDRTQDLYIVDGELVVKPNTDYESILNKLIGAKGDREDNFTKLITYHAKGTYKIKDQKTNEDIPIYVNANVFKGKIYTVMDAEHTAHHMKTKAQIIGEGDSGFQIVERDTKGSIQKGGMISYTVEQSLIQKVGYEWRKGLIDIDDNVTTERLLKYATNIVLTGPRALDEYVKYKDNKIDIESTITNIMDAQVVSSAYKKMLRQYYNIINEEPNNTLALEDITNRIKSKAQQDLYGDTGLIYRHEYSRHVAARLQFVANTSLERGEVKFPLDAFEELAKTGGTQRIKKGKTFTIEELGIDNPNKSLQSRIDTYNKLMSNGIYPTDVDGKINYELEGAVYDTVNGTSQLVSVEKIIIHKLDQTEENQWIKKGKTFTEKELGIDNPNENLQSKIDTYNKLMYNGVYPTDANGEVNYELKGAVYDTINGVKQLIYVKEIIIHKLDQTIAYVMGIRTPVQDYAATPIVKITGIHTHAALEANPSMYPYMGADNDGDTAALVMVKHKEVEYGVFRNLDSTKEDYYDKGKLEKINDDLAIDKTQVKDVTFYGADFRRAFIGKKTAPKEVRDGESKHYTYTELIASFDDKFIDKVYKDHNLASYKIDTSKFSEGEKDIRFWILSHHWITTQDGSNIPEGYSKKFWENSKEYRDYYNKHKDEIEKIMKVEYYLNFVKPDLIPVDKIRQSAEYATLARGRVSKLNVGLTGGLRKDINLGTSLSPFTELNKDHTGKIWETEYDIKDHNRLTVEALANKIYNEDIFSLKDISNAKLNSKYKNKIDHDKIVEYLKERHSEYVKASEIIGDLYDAYVNDSPTYKDLKKIVDKETNPQSYMKYIKTFFDNMTDESVLNSSADNVIASMIKTYYFSRFTNKADKAMRDQETTRTDFINQYLDSLKQQYIITRSISKDVNDVIQEPISYSKHGSVITKAYLKDEWLRNNAVHMRDELSKRLMYAGGGHEHIRAIAMAGENEYVNRHNIYVEESTELQELKSKVAKESFDVQQIKTGENKELEKAINNIFRTEVCSLFVTDEQFDKFKTQYKIFTEELYKYAIAHNGSFDINTFFTDTKAAKRIVEAIQEFERQGISFYRLTKGMIKSIEKLNEAKNKNPKIKRPDLIKYNQELFKLKIADKDILAALLNDNPYQTVFLNYILDVDNPTEAIASLLGDNITDSDAVTRLLTAQGKARYDLTDQWTALSENKLVSDTLDILRQPFSRRVSDELLSKLNFERSQKGYGEINNIIRTLLTQLIREENVKDIAIKSLNKQSKVRTEGDIAADILSDRVGNKVIYDDLDRSTKLKKELRDAKNKINKHNKEIAKKEKEIEALEQSIANSQAHLNAMAYQVPNKAGKQKNTEEKKTIIEELEEDIKKKQQEKEDLYKQTIKHHTAESLGGLSIFLDNNQNNKLRPLKQEDLKQFNDQLIMKMDSYQHPFTSLADAFRRTLDDGNESIDWEAMYKYIKDNYRFLRITVVMEAGIDEGLAKKFYNYVKAKDVEINSFEDMQKVLKDLEFRVGDKELSYRKYKGINDDVKAEDFITPTLKQIRIKSPKDLEKIYNLVTGPDAPAIGFTYINDIMQATEVAYRPYTFDGKGRHVVSKLNMAHKLMMRLSSGFLLRNAVDTFNQLISDMYIQNGFAQFLRPAQIHKYIRYGESIYSVYQLLSEERMLTLADIMITYKNIEEAKDINEIRKGAEHINHYLETYIKQAELIANPTNKTKDGLVRAKKLSEEYNKIKNNIQIKTKFYIIRQMSELLGSISFAEYYEMYDNKGDIPGLRIDAETTTKRKNSKKIESIISKQDDLFKSMLFEISAFMQTEAQVDMFREKQYKELFPMVEQTKANMVNSTPDKRMEDIEKEIDKFRADSENELNIWLSNNVKNYYQILTDRTENLARILGYIFNRQLYGRSFNDSVQQSLKTWFNYGQRSPIEMQMTYDIPYISFPLRSITNWMDRILDPRYAVLMDDIIDGVYGQYADEDGQYSEWEQFMIKNGWIPIMNGFGLRAGSGAFDMINLLTDPVDNIAQRRNPILRGLSEFIQSGDLAKAAKNLATVGLVNRVANAVTPKNKIPQLSMFFQYKEYDKYVPYRYRNTNGRYKWYENIYKNWFNKYGRMRKPTQDPVQLVKNIKWQQYVKYKQMQYKR